MERGSVGSTAADQSTQGEADREPGERWQLDRATQAVLEVARSVLAELELDVVLERVLQSAQELTDATYAALGVLNEQRSELARFITRGIDADTRALIGTLPRGRGVLGTLIANPVALRLSDVGAHPHSYGFPHGHPPMNTFLGVPILVGGAPFGNLYLTEKAGGAEFSAEDEHAVRVLAEFAGMAVDHARRYTATRHRRDELERTVATLEATTQIARAVGGETDLDVILELVAKRGRALVSARALLIELKQGGSLVIAAGAGELPSDLIGKAVPLESTVASQAMRTLTTQRLGDELNRTRFDEHGVGRLGVKAQGGMVVPLNFRGTVHGVLVALDALEDGPEFSADDERLLEAFAASAAIAVATAQTVGSERHRQRLAATEAERQRWARELHDDTLQSLSAIRIGMAGAGRASSAEPMREAIGHAIEQLDDSITSLRRLITDLRPAALDELGVQAALEGLVERAARSGMQIDLSVELAYEEGREPERHVAELETALYRIVQEGLTNAIKHGGARHAVVEIREDPATVALRIRDDGCGFDPEADTEGFGLLGIRERVELLSGELSVESAEQRGTVLDITFPVQRRTSPALGEVRPMRRSGKRRAR
jgi:signal transduction histidine kinase